MANAFQMSEKNTYGDLLGVYKMKACGLLPIMPPGICIKLIVFEAAARPHFLQEI